MINSVVLAGRLTKKIELRQTKTGNAVAQFSLAVQRRFKNANGEKETDFINCVAYGKTAENLALLTEKGSLIGAEGSIRTGSYEKQGQRVYTTDIHLDSFALLESKKTADNNFQQNGYTNTSNYRQNQNMVSEFPSSNMSGTTVEINDDDFPF